MTLSWAGQVWERSMSVAVWSGSLVAWERELAALKERIGPVFGRAETRQTAGAFLDGLLSGVARKTGWLLAEQAGLERPYRMQSLLGGSRRGAGGPRLRDRVRADVIEALGDGDGVLVVDETGFMKKGEHSVGVARQYSGTAGRIENSGWPTTCAEPRGPKRTKGVRRSQRPPDEPCSAAADGARDPLPSGASPAQATDQNPLHHGLVDLATTAPSQSRRRSLPPSS